MESDKKGSRSRLSYKMINDDMKLFHSDDLICYASEEIMSWIAMIVSVSYTVSS